MADFEDYLAGAGSGALAGSALGSLGAIGGGLLGLLGASQKKKPEEYRDPYEQQRLAAANDMQHSTLGQEAAANSATQIKRNALDSYEGIKNNPNFQGNASIQSAAYNKAMRGAESGIVGANIAGAQTDEATHERGAEMLGGIQKSNYQTYLNNYAVKNAPTALDTIATSGLSYLAGKGAENLGNGKSDDTGGDNSDAGSSYYNHLMGSGMGSDWPTANPSGNFPLRLLRD